MNPNIIGTFISSENFTYSASTKTFYAEISMVPEVLRQLYLDSMDCGFVMESAKTGTVVAFVVTSISRDEEGDIDFWEFTPPSLEVNKRPALYGVKVRVFND